MSDYHESRCPECDAKGGDHYPGCNYEGTGDRHIYSSGSRKGITMFGTIMCACGAIAVIAVILNIFNIDVKDVPNFVLIIMFVVATSVIAGVVNAIKR